MIARITVVSFFLFAAGCTGGNPFDRLDKLEKDVAAAQEKADIAKDTADTAKTTADEGKANAKTAKDTADTAMKAIGTPNAEGVYPEGTLGSVAKDAESTADYAYRQLFDERGNAFANLADLAAGKFSKGETRVDLFAVADGLTKANADVAAAQKKAADAETKVATTALMVEAGRLLGRMPINLAEAQRVMKTDKLLKVQEKKAAKDASDADKKLAAKKAQDEAALKAQQQEYSAAIARQQALQQLLAQGPAAFAPPAAPTAVASVQPAKQPPPPSK